MPSVDVVIIYPMSIVKLIDVIGDEWWFETWWVLSRVDMEKILTSPVLCPEQKAVSA